MLRPRAFALFLLVWTTSGFPEAPADLMLIDTAPNASFSSPLAVRAPHDGSGRLFVVEQCGTIRIIKNGVVLAAPFLSISVDCYREEGLLGLAFHPDYASNGIFYVTYTDPTLALGASNDQVLARFTVSADPDVANPLGTQVMRVPDIFVTHQAGDVHFGADGFLYWAMGDGGLQGDPNGFAQCLWKKRADNDPATCSPEAGGGSGPLYYLLGKIMRIDVDHPANVAQANACGAIAGAPAEYSIPSTNPYANLRDPSNATRCAEIWASGLRNPYRFSFDRQTHDMWIGDVGSASTEEVDIQPAASSANIDYNYGWRDCEGPFPQNQTSGTCSTGIMPAMYYFHASGATPGCAVVGGYRYRGPYPRLQGFYLFGDYCAGALVGAPEGADWEFSAFVPATVTVISPYGFGEDEAGNVYLADGAGGVAGAGKVYKYILDGVFADGFGP